MSDPIVIVDYGMGNLGSIRNMFKYIGFESIVSDDLQVISNAQKIILPGVGSFDAAMNRIRAGGFDVVIRKKAMEDAIPVLGICLGMQLLGNSSDEGNLPGLGFIDAACYRFPTMEGLKVPHMGWNTVSQEKPSALTQGFSEDSRFYFTHSYYMKTQNSGDSLLKTHHGVTFDAAVQSKNIYGAQFHPEKSHKFGMRLFSNFAGL